MASGPMTSWEINGETGETVSDFIFMGSKITADGDCSHEIKRRLLLGRKVTSVIAKANFKRKDFPRPNGWGFFYSIPWNKPPEIGSGTPVVVGNVIGNPIIDRTAKKA